MSPAFHTAAKSVRGRVVLIAALLIGLALVLLVALMSLEGRAVTAWTPAPATRPLAVPSPTLSRPPTAVPARPPTATAQAEPGDNTIVITEADIARAVGGSTLGQEGLNVEGLEVRFSGGKMRLTANQLVYGMVSLQDLELVGSLTAVEGRLQLNVDSIQPGGLVGAMIPALANEALAQYGAEWYVESVQVGEGYISLRLR